MQVFFLLEADFYALSGLSGFLLTEKESSVTSSGVGTCHMGTHNWSASSSGFCGVSVARWGWRWTWMEDKWTAVVLA